MNIQYEVNVNQLNSFLSEVGFGFGSVYSCYMLICGISSPLKA